MKCLGLIVSTRRSIFSNDTDRGKFLAWILEATTDILSSPAQLFSSPETVTEFCRLLNRLKSVNQLAELIEKDRYDAWIELVLGFTLKLFETSIEDADENLGGGTGVLYLLQFWSKMSLSVNSNNRPKAHDRLEEMSAIIASTFIQSRVGACRSPGGESGLPFVLGDADQECSWVQSVEHVASIGRLAYVKVCEEVVQVFASLAAMYQDNVVTGGKSGGMVRGLLDRFSVLVYIIGALIGSRPAVSSGDDADVADGELVEKVLQLMYANQALVGQRGKDFADERLDTSICYFFVQFRKSYVGDVTLRSTKVYDRLAQSFQLNTVPSVLNVIVQKLATNLKFWADEQQIVEKSLSLLSEISSGYSSVKLLRKTETARYVMFI
jgi:hypothetical protein